MSKSKTPRCAVEDPACRGSGKKHCFRCGRPVCSACSFHAEYNHYGVRRLCHDCGLASGYWTGVTRRIGAKVSRTSLLLRAAHPPPEGAGMRAARARFVAKARVWDFPQMPPLPRREPDPFGDPVDPPHVSERGKLKH